MSVTELRALVPKVAQKIDTDKFEDALKLCESNGKVAGKMTTFRAYIYYRMANYAKTIEVITNKNTPQSVQDSLGVLHLLAQTYYKMGLQTLSTNNVANAMNYFKQSALTYTKIAQKYPDESKNNAEYIVNALSAYINCNDSDSALQLFELTNVVDNNNNINTKSDVDPTYEVLFNLSFYYLTQFKYSQALKLVDQAITRFKKDFSEYSKLFTALDDNDTEYINDVDFSDLDFDINEYITLQYHRNYISSFIKSTPKQQDSDLFQVDCIIDHLNKSMKEMITASNPNTATTNVLEQFKRINDGKLTKLQLDYIIYNLLILYTNNNQLEYPTKHLSSKDAHTGKLNLLHTAEDGVIVQKDYLALIFNLNYGIKHMKDYAKCEDIINAYLAKHYDIKDADISENVRKNTKFAVNAGNPQYTQIFINVVMFKLYMYIYRSQYQLALNFLTNNIVNNDIILNQYGMKSPEELSYKPSIIALYLTLYEQTINKLTKVAANNTKISKKDPDNENNELMTVYNECAAYLSACLKQKHVLANPTLLNNLHIKHAHFKAQTNDYNGAINTLELLANEAKKSDMTLYHNYITKIIQLCIEFNDNEKMIKFAALLPTIQAAKTPPATLAECYITATTTNILSTQQRQPQTAGTIGSAKPKYTSEKLAAVRRRKKLKNVKKVLLPKNVTMEQYLAVRNDPKHPDRSKINPWRWKPKWERPNASQKKNKDGTFKGPQGSGVSENKVETNVVTAAVDPKAKKPVLPPKKGAPTGKKRK